MEATSFYHALVDMGVDSKGLDQLIGPLAPFPRIEDSHYFDPDDMQEIDDNLKAYALQRTRCQCHITNTTTLHTISHFLGAGSMHEHGFTTSLRQWIRSYWAPLSFLFFNNLPASVTNKPDRSCLITALCAGLDDTNNVQFAWSHVLMIAIKFAIPTALIFRQETVRTLLDRFIPGYKVALVVHSGGAVPCEATSPMEQLRFLATLDPTPKPTPSPVNPATVDRSQMFFESPFKLVQTRGRGRAPARPATSTAPAPLIKTEKDDTSAVTFQDNLQKVSFTDMQSSVNQPAATSADPIAIDSDDSTLQESITEARDLQVITSLKSQIKSLQEANKLQEQQMVTLRSRLTMAESDASMYEARLTQAKQQIKDMEQQHRAENIQKERQIVDRHTKLARNYNVLHTLFSDSVKEFERTTEALKQKFTEAPPLQPLHPSAYTTTTAQTPTSSRSQGAVEAIAPVPVRQPGVSPALLSQPGDSAAHIAPRTLFPLDQPDLMDFTDPEDQPTQQPFSDSPRAYPCRIDTCAWIGASEDERYKHRRDNHKDTALLCPIQGCTHAYVTIEKLAKHCAVSHPNSKNKKVLKILAGRQGESSTDSQKTSPAKASDPIPTKAYKALFDERGSLRIKAKAEALLREQNRQLNISDDEDVYPEYDPITNTCLHPQCSSTKLPSETSFEAHRKKHTTMWVCPYCKDEWPKGSCFGSHRNMIRHVRTSCPKIPKDPERSHLEIDQQRIDWNPTLEAQMIKDKIKRAEDRLLGLDTPTTHFTRSKTGKGGRPKRSSRKLSRSPSTVPTPPTGEEEEEEDDQTTRPSTPDTEEPAPKKVKVVQQPQTYKVLAAQTLTAADVAAAHEAGQLLFAYEASELEQSSDVPPVYHQVATVNIPTRGSIPVESPTMTQPAQQLAPDELADDDRSQEQDGGQAGEQEGALQAARATAPEPKGDSPTTQTPPVTPDESLIEEGDGTTTSQDYEQQSPTDTLETSEPLDKEQ